MTRPALLIAALAFFSIPALAQERTSAPATKLEAAPQDGKDEVRATAGALKDMLGQVHEQLANTNKLASVAKPDQKIALDKSQEALKAAQAGLEASLTEVSNAKPEAWKEAKAKADAALAKAKEALNTAQKAANTAVN